MSRVSVSGKDLQEPCVIVSSAGGQSAFMEKVSRASMFSKKNNDPKNQVKREIEINPDHILVQKLLNMVKRNDTGAESEAIAHSLFETAAMQSGYYVRNPNLYARHFYRVFNSALGVLGQERREIEYDLSEVDLDDEKESNEPDL